MLLLRLQFKFIIMKYILPIFFLISYSIVSQNLLIKNTSFEEELFGWDYDVYTGSNKKRPKASFVTVKPGKDGKSALSVRVEKHIPKGHPYKVYLIQDRLKLKKGKSYKVTFYAKSSVEQDKIYIAVGSGSITNERRLMERNMHFLGNNQWQELSYTFIAENKIDKKPVDFKNSAIYFGFNFRQGEYLIDNVRVERVKK